jgi:hypothetical protein
MGLSGLLAGCLGGDSNGGDDNSDNQSAVPTPDSDAAAVDLLPDADDLSNWEQTLSNTQTPILPGMEDSHVRQYANDTGKEVAVEGNRYESVEAAEQSSYDDSIYNVYVENSRFTFAGRVVGGGATQADVITVMAASPALTAAYIRSENTFP